MPSTDWIRATTSLPRSSTVFGLGADDHVVGAGDVLRLGHAGDGTHLGCHRGRLADLGLDQDVRVHHGSASSPWSSAHARPGPGADATPDDGRHGDPAVPRSAPTQGDQLADGASRGARRGPGGRARHPARRRRRRRRASRRALGLRSTWSSRRSSAPPATRSSGSARWRRASVCSRPDVIAALGRQPTTSSSVRSARVEAEIARRAAAYRAIGRRDARGARSAVVVDDGVATGGDGARGGPVGARAPAPSGVVLGGAGRPAGTSSAGWPTRSTRSWSLDDASRPSARWGSGTSDFDQVTDDEVRALRSRGRRMSDASRGVEIGPAELAFASCSPRSGCGPPSTGSAVRSSRDRPDRRAPVRRCS